MTFDPMTWEYIPADTRIL